MLAFNRRDAGIDGPEFGFALINGLDGDLVVPQPHIGMWVLAIGDLVTSRYVNHQMIVRPTGLQQPLDAGDDLIVDIFAGKGVPRTGPGVRKVDIDQRRSAPEPDAALKPPHLIEFGRRTEGFLESLFEFRYIV